MKAEEHEEQMHLLTESRDFWKKKFYEREKALRDAMIIVNAVACESKFKENTNMADIQREAIKIWQRTKF